MPIFMKQQAEFLTWRMWVAVSPISSVGAIYVSDAFTQARMINFWRFSRLNTSQDIVSHFMPLIAMERIFKTKRYDYTARHISNG
ncbi:hypothetical protein SAMN05421848_1870 [Kushneria avicenniae]|uniref:Uncharacterized protein n=1 Tax=Kushneria avicenniae TaxID=402385 RepID=A0A1I1JZZ7_9GAMM|nr:hypothetical protein SAMN05421848_1870 [Kushneria avicenniae]